MEIQNNIDHIIFIGIIEITIISLQLMKQLNSGFLIHAKINILGLFFFTRSKIRIGLFLKRNNFAMKFNIKKDMLLSLLSKIS